MIAAFEKCEGVGFVEDGKMEWREGCENCLRRTTPRKEWDTYIIAPKIIAFECEFLIEPTPPKPKKETTS